jgi:hypothetical protein
MRAAAALVLVSFEHGFSVDAGVTDCSASLLYLW